MKKIITFLFLIAAIGAKAQTTPTTTSPAHPQLMSTVKIYQDALTKKFYIYNGSSFLWRQLTDSIQVSRMITNIQTGVISAFGRIGAVTAQSGDYSAFYYPLSTNPAGYITASTLTAYQPIGSYEVLSNRQTTLDNSTNHYPTTSAIQPIVTGQATNAANITTLQGQHTSDYAAIGLKQRKILSADPGATAINIVPGDSLNMAMYKLQDQIDSIQVSGAYVNQSTDQLNIVGLKNFTTGVGSRNYTVTNSDGTSKYQIYNDSTRMVVKPYNPMDTVSAGYDITQDLPTGYVIDGSVDYTSIVQAALNAHIHVSMPPFPVGIYFSTATGLIPQSGATIDFPTGAKLKMIPNNQPVVANTGYNYGFFKMQDLYGITINNPNLEGDLFTHLPAAQAIDGSGGMSIYIFGGHDIIINGGTIKSSVGDGIYVATSGSTGNVPTHILINKVDVSRNGRNGISLTSCNYCLVQDVTANYEEKYSPYTGIDVEPSTNLDLVDHIVINNPICLNTVQTTSGGLITQGISTGLRRYYSPGTGQTATTITSKVSHVTVNNPVITGANIGIKAFLSLRSGDTNPNNVTISGDFTVNNPRISSNFGAPNTAGSIDANWVYTINNPTLYDKSSVLVSPFSTVQSALYHNDDQPGTRQIVNQAVNGSPVTTVSGVTIPAVVTPNVMGVYFKDNNIYDLSAKPFLKGTAVTYANRPTGAQLKEGVMIGITDSTTNTWGATIAGGGSNHVLAYYNGSVWTVAGK